MKASAVQMRVAERGRAEMVAKADAFVTMRTMTLEKKVQAMAVDDRFGAEVAVSWALLCQQDGLSPLAAVQVAAVQVAAVQGVEVGMSNVVVVEVSAVAAEV